MWAKQSLEIALNQIQLIVGFQNIISAAFMDKDSGILRCLVQKQPCPNVPSPTVFHVIQQLVTALLASLKRLCNRTENKLIASKPLQSDWKANQGPP